MTIIEAPMTWLDVARSFAQATTRSSAGSIGLLRARVGWFGVWLEASQSIERSTLETWLESVFPGRVKDNPLRIELEGPDPAAVLPVELSVGSQDVGYRQAFGIVDGTIDFVGVRPPEAAPRPVPIAAALSVKGGTGRTTSAIGLAVRWATKTSKPVLLVDADLEAPGVSYLFRAEAGDAKISLEDIIALAHSEDELGSPRTIEFASERLRDHLLSRGVFVLPLRRNVDELASSAIRPEHLSTPERPYALADILSEVAYRLGCGGVVVDVRAGLVPIGVNLAMDPDVSPLIVTTLSDQALRATGSFVRFLSRELRGVGADLKKPLIVVNRVPSLYRQLDMDKMLLKPLTTDLLSALIPDRYSEISSSQGVFDDAIGLDPYSQVEIPELSDIQVSSGSWSAFNEQLSASGFLSIASVAFDNWIESELSRGLVNAPTVLSEKTKVSDTNERRDLLAAFANNLISAEGIKGAIAKPLVTRPLAALTQRFQSELPIAVSEGAKGTGKTLAARYFIAQRSWDAIVRELIGHEGAVPGKILPVCASLQSSSSYQEQVDAARAEVASSLGLGTPQPVSASISWLKEQLGRENSERAWVDIWLDVSAWAAGFRPGVAGVGAEFLSLLRDSGATAVAVFEGLEELYTFPEEAGVGSAMRAALVSLPQRLRSEVRRPLGAILFARRDTVEAAIIQNLDQYRREYGPFALTWTDSDVLELAAWLATQAGALNGLWHPGFADLDQDQKVRSLDALWGRKLGPDDAPGRRIREAYTATWVIAVLSDLQGRLVPRDLIRLLYNAASVSVDQDEKEDYASRLLIPRALKKAVEPTSVKKVEETEEEIQELRPIFEKFRSHADTVAVPLDSAALDQLGLERVEIETLKRHGIVFGDASPYEVPELFRRGLRLKHAGARRSVVDLYRRARKLS